MPKRLIPDINVLLSGVTSERGPARELYLAAGRFDVIFVLCPEHFTELRRVLAYPQVLTLGQGITPADAFGLAIELVTMGEMFQRPLRQFDWPSCPDPKDWYLLNLLMTADADGIVTKDKHLLHLHNTLNLPIHTPKQLVQMGIF